MNNDLKIFFNFINDYKLYRLFIIVVAILVIIFSYVEVTTILDGIELLRNIENIALNKKGVKIVLFLSLKILFSYIVFLLLPIVSDYYLTKCYRICICYYILKALNINQATYNKLGPANIRSIIDRKVFHYVHGFHLLLFSFLYSVAFSLSICFFLFLKFNIYIILYSFISIALVLSITIPVTNIRNNIRKKYTGKYDKVIKGLYRIISNYDIIKANNNEQTELDVFNIKLRYIQYYGIISAILASLGSFLARSIVIVPNAIFFYFVVQKNDILSIKTAADFVLFNKLFCEFKSKLIYIKNEYNALFQYYIDIKNNNWDEIRYDIENLVVYYEYKQTEERDIEFRNIEQTINLKNNNQIISRLSRNDKDFEIIKRTVIDTQQKGLNGDGKEKFIFNKAIKFQEFVLCIENRILTNPSNFIINKGEKVGLVGKNGVGKSTLVNVFLRYRDYKGALFIDDIEMRDIYKIDQRDKISFISQIPGILSGTIIDNLIYSNSNFSANDVKKLCNLYNMHFNDLEKDVGDNGKFMSGGEKQRISFLRGVIKNGDVFILDEPTANMDPKLELNLIEKIHVNLSDKTVIAIIHNHTLLKKFDKIIGIHNNEIKVYNGYDDFLIESHLY